MRTWLLAGFLAAGLSGATAESLTLPAYTAYTLPDADGARISERGGVTRWLGTNQTVNWYGEFTNTGPLTAQLQLRLSPDQRSRLRLTVGNTSRELEIVATNRDSLRADFGSFTISEPGYQRFTLSSLNSDRMANGDLEALLLTGPAVAQAHFNLKERRNAASVHLAYPVGRGTNIKAFYCEVTAVEDPLWTFYMACGWHRGYFGMQVNSPTERRIIFSVWDSANEGVDRAKVAGEDRVTLVAKGEGVYSGDFGNEGTGGHSHLKFAWKTGEKQRFLLTARPVDATHTIYSGYYFRPDKSAWMLISSWKAPKDGSWLRGLHSFSENFGGANGHLVRKARFGNQWYQTDQGQWTEITTATFSHDATGRADRRDRLMGVEAGQFFLSHGGFVPGYTRYGEKFSRVATGQRPDDLPVKLASELAAAATATPTTP
jgi:hypothetical protein